MESLYSGFLKGSLGFKANLFIEFILLFRFAISKT